MQKERELYVLSDGTFQCGNCGELHGEEVMECKGCGAKVTGVVDEGDPDGIAGEAWEGEE